MEENRFFRFVWRVNGIAIMLLLIFIAGFSVYNVITSILPGDKPVVIKNIAEDPAGEEKWSLGTPVTISGTDHVFIPLVSEKKEISVPGVQGMKKSALHGYGSYFSQSRNLLFVNKKTREMHWLFKDNEQLITDIDLLSIQEQHNGDRKVVAILYNIIKKDTNSDGQLNSEDITDIAFSYPDGNRFKELFQTVERLFGVASLDEKEAVVLYQSKGKGYASTINLKDMTVKGTDEMPKVEKGGEG